MSVNEYFEGRLSDAYSNVRYVHRAWLVAFLFFLRKSIMDVNDVTVTAITATNINIQAETLLLFIHLQTQILNFICFGRFDVSFCDLIHREPLKIFEESSKNCVIYYGYI